MEVLSHLIEEKCKDKEWIPVKASRSGIAFPTYSLRMTLYSSQGQMAVIVQLLGRLWMSFVSSQANQLVKPNLEFFSLLMWIETLGKLFMTYWGFLQLLTLANT
ncbi:hypothetical protein SO802_005684 [Lithocarpus litseifolius]|uniref:Uncharacterized protein n=1 Tax=Lithocarpus litseifolius TaxID=425828 RepID=A0AAW2DNH1_9ROSI